MKKDIEIKGKAHIYGLIGYPVKHSFSPAMHNAAFKAAGINAEYRLFEVKPEELEDFLLNSDKETEDIKGNKIRAGDIKGFNITIPHKVRAKDILRDRLVSSKGLEYTALAGAVNTVKREYDKFDCQNTDVLAFAKSLEEDLRFDIKDKNIFLIGCGGAGRAVVAGLAWKNIDFNKIYIYDSNKTVSNFANNHFSQFSNILKGKLEFVNEIERLPEILKDSQLLVNTSPVGMKKEDSSVIDESLLHEDLSVYDVVYNMETQLIKDARSLNLSAVGGLSMLLYQGVLAWELWTGKEAPIEVMKKALEEELKKIC